jgi:hypothetical protein
MIWRLPGPWNLWAYLTKAWYGEVEARDVVMAARALEQPRLPSSR